MDPGRRLFIYITTPFPSDSYFRAVCQKDTQYEMRGAAFFSPFGEGAGLGEERNASRVAWLGASESNPTAVP